MSKSPQSEPESRAAPGGDRPGPEGSALATYEDTLQLPGFGRRRNRCQGFQPTGFCERGHVTLGEPSCLTRDCPKDWHNWLRRAAESIVGRVGAYRTAATGADKRAAHVVVSPPQDLEWSARDVWDARSEAYDVAQAAGVQGGAMVTHPYRTNERADMLYEAATEQGEVTGGKWAFLRDLAGESWSNMRRYVEPAPHFHIVGPVGDVDPSAAPEGWVVERVRTFDRWDYRDPEAYRDMFGAAAYVLSHGAAQQGRATTTYFGEVHPASFNPEQELPSHKRERIDRWVSVAPDTEGGAGLVDGDDGTPEECPHDGCEAAVRPLSELRAFLREQQAALPRPAQRRLVALLKWSVEQSDRPPPRVRSDRRQVQTWLDKKGRMYLGLLGDGTEQGRLPGGTY